MIEPPVHESLDVPKIMFINFLRKIPRLAIQIYAQYGVGGKYTEYSLDEVKVIK